MNQVGGIANYNGSFWYDRETTASDGKQETDFRELVDNAGQEESGKKEYVEPDSAGPGERLSRPAVSSQIYDFFGKVQSREPNQGLSVNILA